MQTKCNRCGAEADDRKGARCLFCGQGVMCENYKTLEAYTNEIN